MRKQLLYLDNNLLTVYAWAKGAISLVQTFQNDAIGRAEFSTYLSDKKDIATCLLVDMIEEAFQRDTVPHVLGNARRTLIKRRIGQIYRDTPFRQGTVQGRVKQGRKDDQMLFSALTNPEIVKPWVDALIEKRIPVAGIFSLALLSPLLFKKFKFDNGPMFLISHQSNGLRQTYLQDGVLIFSRLTSQAQLKSEAMAESVMQEVEKTRQYLASNRQLPFGAVVKIAFIANDTILDALQSVCVDTATVRHRFIKFDEGAHLLGLKPATGISFCDPLFLSVLGQKAPASHYPIPEQTHFYQLWRTRLGIYGASAATVAGGLLWTGITTLTILDTQQKNRQLESDIQAAEAQYQAIIQSMPSTVSKPQNMKDTVTIEHMISKNAPEPVALFSVVSRALNGLPEIRINQMQWAVSEAAPTTNVDNQPPPLVAVAETAPPIALIGIPKMPYQVLTIEGAIEPFKDDYRSALDSVRKLSTELSKNKQLQVEMTQAPIDIRPSVKLDGKAGDDDGKAKARFIMKLVWSP